MSRQTPPSRTKARKNIPPPSPFTKQFFFFPPKKGLHHFSPMGFLPCFFLGTFDPQMMSEVEPSKFGPSPLGFQETVYIVFFPWYAWRPFPRLVHAPGDQTFFSSTSPGIRRQGSWVLGDPFVKFDLTSKVFSDRGVFPLPRIIVFGGFPWQKSAPPPRHGYPTPIP